MRIGSVCTLELYDVWQSSISLSLGIRSFNFGIVVLQLVHSAGVEPLFMSHIKAMNLLQMGGSPFVAVPFAAAPFAAVAVGVVGPGRLLPLAKALGLGLVAEAEAEPDIAALGKASPEADPSAVASAVGAACSALAVTGGVALGSLALVGDREKRPALASEPPSAPTKAMPAPIRSSFALPPPAATCAGGWFGITGLLVVTDGNAGDGSDAGDGGGKEMCALGCCRACGGVTADSSVRALPIALATLGLGPAARSCAMKARTLSGRRERSTLSASIKTRL